jgi:hypothetical protein
MGNYRGTRCLGGEGTTYHSTEASDVQPVKISKWCPPLMGQGKCDTYCERCWGKIMRNSTGTFEETPYCPHCGARMDSND